MTEETKVAEENHINDTQLAMGNDYLHALVPYGPNKMLREMTRRIMALDKSKIPLNTSEAAHTAQLSLSTDLNYFANELWVWVTINKNTKKREYHWMPGRMGLTRHANKQAKEMGIKWSATEPVELTLNEKLRLSIPTDGLAVRVKVRDNVEMTSYNETLKTMSDAIGAEAAYAELGPPPASVGIGVLLKSEMNQLDKTGRNKMPHINRAAKRARTEALKGKFNLQFGGGNFGAPADYSDYIHGDVVDVDFEEVDVPVGMAAELFGDIKERLNPEYWGDLPEKVVEAELARDKFVASEILAYTTLLPKGLNEELVLELFGHAQEVYKEDEEQDLKTVSEKAFRILMNLPEPPEEVKEEPKEKPATKKAKPKKKAAPKKKEPKKETKKETPKKPAIEVNDKGLTKTEKEALTAMSKDYPRYTPKHNLDWETAFKYIDLKKVSTSHKEFQAIVKTMKGDVRLGMCRMLGYL